MTAQQKFTAKVSSLSISVLKDIAKHLMNDTRDGSEMVLSAALDVLMARLPEDQFVAFCEELEA